MFDFHYHDNWALETDGDGPSLVLREEAGRELLPDEPTSWRVSREPFGSPGAAEIGPLRLMVNNTEHGVQIEFIGVAGNSYRLEALSEPTGTWQPADTRIAGPDGTVQVLITPSADFRLYRMVAP
jgi:hypothetical protein